MNRYFNLILAAGILLPAMAVAQNELDALRYGQVTGAGTARALSLGGAGGSYGADFSSLSINPAGIGQYRSSEIMITPVLRLNNIKGTYLGSANNDDRTRLNLSNFGVVFTKAAKGREYESSGWKSFSVGLGFNRIADFTANGYYAGNNSLSSITEEFAADAKYNGVSDQLAPPFGFLGYEGYVLDANHESIPYNNIISKGGSVNQSKSWNSKGGINEWNLSLGGNYMEKLLLGASVALTSYKYDRNTNYTEKDATGNPNNDFDFLSYNELLTTTGIGFNAKLGAIYVINDVIRVGAAFHTPTWIAFTDLSDYDITTNTEGYKASLGGSDTDPVSRKQPASQYQFDYSLRTPWRAVLSATALMGKYGFITADYEYAAYNAMRYNFRENSFNDYENALNQTIKDTYRGTHNFRVGVEGKLSNFMGRLGFAYYSSPFRQSDIFDGQRMDFSAGVGARFGGFFVDLAYVRIMQKQSEYGYPLLMQDNADLNIRKIPVPLADLKYGNNLIALTLGFKFGS
ncbi:OmpP1/FadL family transporter [Taibaiella koreensis]|uniref:OmpP1/FadL family transporter n=1 Tax=Taibaiella koreensis TaxID=1268548 RepID=UPI000E59FB19|nr:hypothetical protein [Taibaiella koreensis]